MLTGLCWTSLFLFVAEGIDGYSFWSAVSQSEFIWLQEEWSNSSWIVLGEYEAVGFSYLFDVWPGMWINGKSAIFVLWRLLWIEGLIHVSRYCFWVGNVIAGFFMRLRLLNTCGLKVDWMIRFGLPPVKTRQVGLFVSLDTFPCYRWGLQRFWDNC